MSRRKIHLDISDDQNCLMDSKQSTSGNNPKVSEDTIKHISQLLSAESDNDDTNANDFTQWFHHPAEEESRYINDIDLSKNTDWK